ncbi:unnamed protein product [Microthlaspi erraticum]|uniref:Uncharacterized protein n=1 Tax=Microthlaspi erraticum TaxID=1685480 RepID=A0A6D2HQA8_9BRAS|nr:unnamed protein product [Microthlaspi erraticum]
MPKLLLLLAFSASFPSLPLPYVTVVFIVTRLFTSAASIFRKRFNIPRIFNTLLDVCRFLVARPCAQISSPQAVLQIYFPGLILHLASLGGKIPYVVVVYEAEDFCNLVANESILENISRVGDQ